MKDKKVLKWEEEEEDISEVIQKNVKFSVKNKCFCLKLLLEDEDEELVEFLNKFVLVIMSLFLVCLVKLKSFIEKNKFQFGSNIFNFKKKFS